LPILSPTIDLNLVTPQVQAVLLLLGGKELPPGSVPGPSSSQSSYSKVETSPGELCHLSIENISKHMWC
jgi:hypothetical protein